LKDPTPGTGTIGPIRWSAGVIATITSDDGRAVGQAQKEN
jgi:hypothetical protein